MVDDKFYDELSKCIDTAFESAFGRKTTTPKVRKSIMQDEDKGASLEEKPLTAIYESIEEYTAKTGKRFRMTKDQKQRNLTRDEAFSEFTQIEKDLLGGMN